VKFTFLIAIITIFLLNSCASNFYQVPIAQGNIISIEMLSKLEKGLTKVQVQYIMGTPSIKDPFDSSVWNYIGYEIVGNEVLREIHYSLYFQNEKLDKWTKKVDSDSNENLIGVTEELNKEKSEE
jgi:outer membrane protein assembly factor BamE (lipoprotein component of BamABCDE complex)